MRIITKRIKVISMTQEELDKFHDLMAQARDGHMSHYAESQLEDGSYLGVSVVEQHEPVQRQPKRFAKDGQAY